MDRDATAHRPRVARRMGASVILAWTLWVWAAGALALGGTAVAQSPERSAAPTPAAVGGPVDPRSSGEGPGLEAEPLIVLAGVVLLGLAAAGGTALYVRLTRED